MTDFHSSHTCSRPQYSQRSFVGKLKLGLPRLSSKITCIVAQNQIQPQGDNLRKNHKRLSVVLHTFKTTNDRLKNVTLPIGPTGRMTVAVKTYILFTFQDMKVGDMLCGCFGTHT
jgi:hypothetical protein